MTFTPFQNLVPKAARRAGIYRQVEAAHICAIYVRVAPGIVHPRVLDFTKPRGYKDGAFIIDTAGSVWAHELKSCEEGLIEAINKELGKPLVKSIKTMAA